MVQLIDSNIQNYNSYVENLFQDLELWFQHFKGVHVGKNGTERPFLENCGSLSAIKQPKMVQLIRSKIQNYNLYVGNIFQDLEFLFQHFNCVCCENNGTNWPFLGKLWLAMCNKTAKNGPINYFYNQDWGFIYEKYYSTFRILIPAVWVCSFWRRCTKTPFLVDWGLPSAIKQTKMVQSIGSKIKN